MAVAGKWGNGVAFIGGTIAASSSLNVFGTVSSGLVPNWKFDGTSIGATINSPAVGLVYQGPDGSSSIFRASKPFQFQMLGETFGRICLGPTTSCDDTHYALAGDGSGLYLGQSYGTIHAEAALDLAAGLSAPLAAAQGGTGVDSTATFPTSGTVAVSLSATTGSIGGSALGAGACASGTATLTGVSTAMTETTTPAADPGAGFTWQAFMSATDTVTVRVCNFTAGSLTPTAEAYNVRAIK